jgi:hypothetical protein
LANLSDNPLVKQIHEAEREIACIESKIETAELNDAYPHEFAAMRSEQEHHRQDLLKCKTDIDSSLLGAPHADEHH